MRCAAPAKQGQTATQGSPLTCRDPLSDSPRGADETGGCGGGGGGGAGGAVGAARAAAGRRRGQPGPGHLHCLPLQVRQHADARQPGRHARGTPSGPCPAGMMRNRACTSIGHMSTVRALQGYALHAERLCCRCVGKAGSVLAAVGAFTGKAVMIVCSVELKQSLFILGC